MKTKEEKSLLHNDLCARLPHKVKCIVDGLDDCTLMPSDIEEEREIKPYLRPMSSMTEEERKEIGEAIKKDRISPYGEIKLSGVDNLLLAAVNGATNLIDWLNAHHFDYRGLIERGLAIAVTKENNPYKQ